LRERRLEAILGAELGALERFAHGDNGSLEGAELEIASAPDRHLPDSDGNRLSCDYVRVHLEQEDTRDPSTVRQR
jgi:hypothetical protein